MSLDATLQRLEAKAGARVAALALELQGKARRNASGQNGGPNVVTGNLRNAIQAVRISPLEWQVGVTASPNPDSGVPASVYGPHLERGTQHMPAQPFMRPAVDELMAEVGP